MFILLTRAKVTKIQRMLMLSKLSLDGKAKLSDNMCKELKIVKKNYRTGGKISAK